MKYVENSIILLDEMIGAQMEIALNTYLTKLVNQYTYHFLAKGPVNPKTGKIIKLLIHDNSGNAYNIDSLIADESIQPIVLIEYKYTRYKKHNRDKGSWLCTAHSAIRRRYNSVRSSFAILAGSWSGSSVAMMKSHDINIFIIPFDKITELLKKHDIIFDWGEKDRHIAVESWTKYTQLSPTQKLEIAEEMIAVIKTDLEIAIEKTLDNTTKREIEKVIIEIHTNIGEVKCFEFKDTQSALDFLEDFSFEEILNNANSFSLFDKPTSDIDDE